jgi:hypothetical protein
MPGKIALGMLDQASHEVSRPSTSLNRSSRKPMTCGYSHFHGQVKG